MVCNFEPEEYDLSYVRVNVSAGRGHAAVKAYITKNLSATDKNVVNAGLLHPDLLVQPQRDEAVISTGFWGAVPRDEPNSMNIENKFEKNNDDQQQTQNGDTATAAMTPRIVLKPVQRSAALPNNGTVISGGPELTMTHQMQEQPTKISTGVKRALQGNSVPENSSKLFKIASSMTGKSQMEMENERLKKHNAVLQEQNIDLQQKLSLLNRLLMNPKKLDLLHSRLKEMHKTAS